MDRYLMLPKCKELCNKWVVEMDRCQILLKYKDLLSKWVIMDRCLMVDNCKEWCNSSAVWVVDRQQFQSQSMVRYIRWKVWQHSKKFSRKTVVLLLIFGLSGVVPAVILSQYLSQWLQETKTITLCSALLMWMSAVKLLRSRHPRVYLNFIFT